MPFINNRFAYFLNINITMKKKILDTVHEWTIVADGNKFGR